MYGLGAACIYVYPLFYLYSTNASTEKGYSVFHLNLNRWVTLGLGGYFLSDHHLITSCYEFVHYFLILLKLFLFNKIQ